MHEELLVWLVRPGARGDYYSACWSGEEHIGTTQWATGGLRGPELPRNTRKLRKTRVRVLKPDHVTVQWVRGT